MGTSSCAAGALASERIRLKHYILCHSRNLRTREQGRRRRVESLHEERGHALRTVFVSMSGSALVVGATRVHGAYCLNRRGS